MIYIYCKRERNKISGKRGSGYSFTEERPWTPEEERPWTPKEERPWTPNEERPWTPEAGRKVFLLI